LIKQWPEIWSLGGSKTMLALLVEPIHGTDKNACKEIISTLNY
jgi:hypothetical protein